MGLDNVARIIFGIIVIIVFIAILYPSNNDANMAEMQMPDAKIEIQGSTLGSKEAPVTIIEYSDFQCPYCEKFFKQTKPILDDKYIRTGKVRFEYKHLPIAQIHPFAQKAAEATECAKDQGKFWDMHDLLFKRGVSGGIASYKGFASELGLNRVEFDRCLDDGMMTQKVQEDMQEAQLLGITGTPGFSINGRIIKGAQPFSVFEKIIEKELS